MLAVESITHRKPRDPTKLEWRQSEGEYFNDYSTCNDFNWWYRATC